MLKQLASDILEISPKLQFTLLEIGARGVHANPEPFYQIVDLFPGSTIAGFEIDEELCHSMNKEAGRGLKFFPVALSDKEGEQCMYITEHPMCCSLYEPNPIYIDLYNNLGYQSLIKTETIRTTTLDKFAKENKFDAFDFIKIDVQGAELDVFKGAIELLSSCLYIVSEVEFV